jgi:hypothetical protein
LRRELERRFAEEVQKIDILRQPRRWMAAPFQWLRSLVAPASGGGGESPRATTSEWLAGVYETRFQEFCARLQTELLELADRARSAASPSLDWRIGESLPLPAARAALRGVFSQLQVHIRAETDRIAEGLPVSKKLGFYGTQVVVQALTFAACWKTGGLLSFAELAAQGLASPFVASFIGQFVSSAEASAVERRLRGAFAEAMFAAISPLLDPLARQLDRALEVLPAWVDWQAAAHAWDASRRSDGTV